MMRLRCSSCPPAIKKRGATWARGDISTKNNKKIKICAEPTSNYVRAAIGPTPIPKESIQTRQKELQDQKYCRELFGAKINGSKQRDEIEAKSTFIQLVSPEK